MLLAEVARIVGGRPLAALAVGGGVTQAGVTPVALSFCTTDYLLHTKFAKRFGTSFLKGQCDRTLGGAPAVGGLRAARHAGLHPRRGPGGLVALSFQKGV